MRRSVCYIVSGLFVCVCLACAKTGRNARQSTGMANYVHSKEAVSKQGRGQLPNRHLAGESKSGRGNTIMQATEIFEKYNSAVFMIFTTDGYNQYQGSGFFISADGLAVSNYHVFKGTAVGQEVVKLVDGRMFRVKEVLAKSDEHDFILFRVEGRFNHIPISKRGCRVGERVYALGSPKGMENTFSSGEVSQIRDGHYIQISCPIDHGSSGGALINAYGEVIGITTAGRDDSGANLNFAKDIVLVRETLSRLSIMLEE